LSEVRLYHLGAGADAPFPPGHEALRRPNGLLAWGGDLQPERLLRAYRQGIFPWYSEGEPVLWWTPDPRCVLLPDAVYVSRRTRQRFNSGRYRVSADTAFAEVMAGCAAPRGEQSGTWITPDLQAAFIRLHELGHAHSVEVWQGPQLVGGLYGMAMGKVFFAESMFSRQSDTSKIALIALCRQLQQWLFGLVDCQVTNPHLLSMGACEIPRAEFETRLAQLTVLEAPAGNWAGSFTVSGRW
jgi:leucyl/phenylalanyl-tRNA--protein transferase